MRSPSASTRVLGRGRFGQDRELSERDLRPITARVSGLAEQRRSGHYIEYRYIEEGAIVPQRKVSRPPEAYLPLPPATFQILLALTDGELHGYAIMKTV